ncbi:MAG: hypothetical protein HC780_13075 [Leptolyngbyaceae cyanobacterium CSU_1_3]|nr:hypothetical protein [Leptolyngbyaceae cyanobacterium CSU_1_3]
MSEHEPSPLDSSEPRSSISESSVTQPPATEQSNSVRRVLRSTSIKTLRSTGQWLESIASRLESAPADADAKPLLPPQVQTQLRSWWQRLLPVWGGLLRQIRTRLPENLNQKLGDRALSGMLVGAAIVLLWTTSSLFASKPAPPVVAAKPISPEVAPSPTAFPTELTAPTAIDPAPIPEPTLQPFPSSDPPEVPELLVPEVSEVSEAPDVSVDATLEAPTAEAPALVVDRPSEAPSVEVPARPDPVLLPPELTPEQQLIASLQDQLAEVNPETKDLIESVQTNLRSSRLTVKLSDRWYGLNSSEQNQLADAVLSRAQTLDFSHLKIIDRQGTLLARDPVVGSSIVILHRRQQA